MSQKDLSELVEKYLALGGQRKAAVDDNLITTRLWEEEPAEAAEFWQRNMESLSADRRKELDILLPSINDDAG